MNARAAQRIPPARSGRRWMRRLRRGMGLGLRRLFKLRWLTHALSQPWVRRLKANLNQVKPHHTPIVSLISQGNKSLVVGLEWKSIIAAGSKAGRQIASQSDATHMTEYLGQCVGLGRLKSPPSANMPAGLAVLVMRLLQTDRTSVLLHLPEQSKVWALQVNHRRPYGTEALLSYEEVGPWLDQHASQFVHVHSDLASEDLQAYFQPEHIFHLTLDHAFKSQVFRADQLVSLRRMGLKQLLQKYPSLKWVGLAVLIWQGFDFGLTEYQSYVAEQIEIQRRLRVEKEVPTLLWEQQIKSLLERLPAPDGQSMQQMVSAMHGLPVWIRGWQLNKLTCLEQVTRDKDTLYLAKTTVTGQPQTWHCMAFFGLDPQSPGSATFAELAGQFPPEYEVRWVPLKNFELSWTLQRTVQGMQTQRLDGAKSSTLKWSSLFQQLSGVYSISADLKWTALPFPAVRRSDGSDAPKPNATLLPVMSKVSVSGPLYRMPELLKAFPADWRKLEVSFSPQVAVVNGVTRASMPEAAFVLSGALYANE
ncbi:MAG: hypothetical protein QM527_08000 [Alphaproteobacteria bacterium]|nr:hypothetical protein [Alphaproteobacteria bacterium]